MNSILNNLKIIKSKKIIFNDEVKPATILIRNGVIIDIKEYDFIPNEEFELLNKETINNEDIVIMGGLVNYNGDYCDNIISMKKSSIQGGFTTFITLPSNNNSFESCNKTIEELKGNIFTDICLLGNISSNNLDEIKRMVFDAGIVGFKSFLLNSDIQESFEIMKSLSSDGGRDVVILFNSDDFGNKSFEDIINLSKNNNNIKIQFDNISNENIDIINSIQDDFQISIGITYDNFDDKINNQLLWDIIKNGKTNLIISANINNSLTNLGLPILWTEAKKRNIPINIISKLLSENPSYVFGLYDRKGSIKIGRDADFILWNPTEEFTLNKKNYFGVIYETILHGKSVYKKVQSSYQEDTQLGQHLIPTKIHTNLTYPNPYLPKIELLNSLKDKEFLNCIHLLFETAPPLAIKLYSNRPFQSYEQLIDCANNIIKSLNDEDQIIIINSHPRIGLNPNEIKKTSSISYREQGLHNEIIDQHTLNVYSTLKQLNDQYESKFGFKFIEFVNGRSKEQIIPVLKERLNNTKNQEIDICLKAIIDISYSRLLKL